MCMERYEGKNLDEALENAARSKGCGKEDLTYNIVSEKQGLFGFGSKVEIEAYFDGDIEKFIIKYLSTYFDGIEMQVDVKCKKEDYFFKVELDAENNAILIGKKGQTLQDINNVVKAAASSAFKKRVIVVSDINGYKEEKYHKECSMALRVAKTVQKTKINASLDPMPNDERKAIHSYLVNMPRIRTVSEGDGKERHIVIVYDENKH